MRSLNCEFWFNPIDARFVIVTSKMRSEVRWNCHLGRDKPGSWIHVSRTTSSAAARGWKLSVRSTMSEAMATR